MEQDKRLINDCVTNIRAAQKQLYNQYAVVMLGVCYRYNFTKKNSYQQDKKFDSVNYKGGIYLQSAIGCLLSPLKKRSFYFSVNYGLKKLSKNAGYIIPGDFPPYNETFVAMDRYNYSFKTISIKAGYKF